MLSPLSLSILIISLFIFITDPYFSNKVLSKHHTEINDNNSNPEGKANSEEGEEKENNDIE